MTNSVLDKLYFSPVKSLSFINTKNLIVKKDIGIKNDRILAFTRIINEEEANNYQKNPNKRNLKFFLTLRNSPFLNKYNFQMKDNEIGPGSDKQSDDELNEYIRSKAETAYHPCGTCKMGVDDMAVVDENLKVKGIQNLRVVDASVMPEIPSANLNAPTLMIAEKASDLICNNI